MTEKTLKELQKEIDDYIQQYKCGYWPIFEMLAHTMEELGELARELMHKEGNKKKKHENEGSSLEQEIGDLLFNIACIANAQKIDLQTALEQTIKKANQRDKNRWEKKKQEKPHD